MKRITLLCISFLLTLTLSADEGMWRIPDMTEQNRQQMIDLGFSMDFDQLYNDENPSLKDAIVQLNIGCTGVSVSKSGLIFTNHHCGYNAIQSLSSVEHDYLTDGFVSQSFEEELPVKGMSIRYFVRSVDLTAEVLANIPSDMEERARLDSIYQTILRLEDELNKEEEGLEIEIKPYYANNVYVADYYRRFTDVRLVFAPPSSVGKFGGDTDNWMWPRQTGDFSVFRVYADKENQPADYSEENIPYTPTYVAPVSLTGYREGDFSMIMGYPGSTNRYLSSWGVERRVNSSNEPLIRMRGAKQKIWEEKMLQSDAIRIKYSSKFMVSSNYWKNSIGMNRGIERMKVIERKQEQEAEFREWLSANPEKQAIYGEALPLIEKGYTSSMDAVRSLTYLREFNSGVEMLSVANAIGRAFSQEGKDPDAEKEMSHLANFFKDYEPNLDQEVLAALLTVVKENVSPEYLPDIFQEIDKRYKSYSHYAEEVFKKSAIPYPGKLNALLKDKKGAKKMQKDPAYRLAKSVLAMLEEISREIKDSQMDIRKGERLFMAGLMEKTQGRSLPADANFTLRLTYGSVGGYQPYDGAWYNYYSTPQGILEKEDPDNHEFFVQTEILDLLKKGEFGRYANTDGSLFVNFLSNNDITGGNSGSPIFNSKGEVIGLAFDGNWEAMSGDIAFENEIQRTISVDIRYVLFIIEQWGKAQRLIEELTIE